MRTENATGGSRITEAAISLARHLGVTVAEAWQMLANGTAAAEIRKQSRRGITDPIEAYICLMERRASWSAAMLSEPSHRDT